MSLNSAQRKILKTKGHILKPKINIGKNGLGDKTIQSLKQLLNDLSLIKIKILGGKAERALMLEQLIDLKLCEVVSTIGSSVLLYKKNHLNLLDSNSSSEEVCSE